MYFFETHQIDTGGDTAIVYELVAADDKLVASALKAFTGQSFPVYFGSKKVAATLERGAVYEINGRTFGRVWTEANPARAQEMLQSAFGGKVEDYDALKRPDPANEGEFFFVRKLQPTSDTVELLGRTFADNPLRNDTQVVGLKPDGSRGSLVRSKSQTVLIVVDQNNTFSHLLTKTSEIAAWFSDIIDGRYDGSLTFEFGFGPFLPGEITVFRGAGVSEEEGTDEITERAKTVNIAEAMGSDTLGFILKNHAVTPFPVRETREIDVAAITAIASASRDGVLLPSMEWLPTKVTTEIASLHLASLYAPP